MSVSGWCSTHGRPQCARCRVVDCSHDCHSVNHLRNKGIETVIDIQAWDNGGTNKSGPAGAQTPVAPGLTDHEGIG